LSKLTKVRIANQLLDLSQYVGKKVLVHVSKHMRSGVKHALHLDASSTKPIFWPVSHQRPAVLSLSSYLEILPVLSCVVQQPRLKRYPRQGLSYPLLLVGGSCKEHFVCKMRIPPPATRSPYSKSMVLESASYEPRNG
jgi:hypothetical protein